MNFGILVSAAPLFAGGGFAGGRACAMAPEIISALTAADIIRVLSIFGLLRGFLARQGRGFPCCLPTRERRARSRLWEPGAGCPRPRQRNCGASISGRGRKTAHNRDAR